MRGRQNILAFNPPQKNSDSPELSGQQSVIQSTFMKAHCMQKALKALLLGDNNGGSSATLVLL